MIIKEKNQTGKPSYLTGKRPAWNILDLPQGTQKIGGGEGQSILVFILEGGLCVSVDNFKQREVNLGEMFLIPPRSNFHVRTLKDSNRIMTCFFYVEKIFFQSIPTRELLSFSASNQPGIISLPINLQLDRYLAMLSDYIGQGIDSLEFYELKKKEFFFLLFAGYTSKELAGLLYPVMGEDPVFKDFIMGNYMKVKDIGELAEMMNYSTSGFIKKFRRCFNESPYKWIMTQKAGKILHEINEGIISLQELAFKYKFSSYQHFATFCKVQYGAPPSEIRDKANRIKQEI